MEIFARTSACSKEACVDTKKQGNIMLKVGDPAPDFAVPDQNGHVISLSTLKNKACLVLFFYPKDNTPGCTAQSCSFRDNYQGFKELGAQVVGVSSDSSASHQGFAATHNLPYPLLSDDKGKLRKLFGVKSTLGLLPGRATFVVDRKGIIRYALSSQFNIQRHIDESLEVMRTINAEYAP